MKPLEQNEIYQNLSTFLKSRGIELKDGSYAQGIEKSCSLLTDAINLGQQSFKRAQTEINKSVEQVRQVIHKKTAPKRGQTTAAKGATPPVLTPTPAGKAKSGAKKAAPKRKAPKRTSA